MSRSKHLFWSLCTWLPPGCGIFTVGHHPCSLSSIHPPSKWILKDSFLCDNFRLFLCFWRKQSLYIYIYIYNAEGLPSTQDYAFNIFHINTGGSNLFKHYLKTEFKSYLCHLMALRLCRSYLTSSFNFVIWKIKFLQ